MRIASQRLAETAYVERPDGLMFFAVVCYLLLPFVSRVPPHPDTSPLPRQKIATLARPDFSVDLSGVKDGRTRGLLKGLLDPDPKKRLRYFDSPMTRLALL